MARYFFIQSQDPFTEVRTTAQFDLAQRLAAGGNDVSMLLVQNGVTAAREGAICEQFDALCDSGITVLADGFSLRMREIETAQLKAGVMEADVDAAIEALLAGDKVIWN